MNSIAQPARDDPAGAWAAFARDSATALERFERSLGQPARAQTAVFDEVIGYAKETAFGRAFGFAEIRDIEQFRERVPITGWSEHAAWVERAKREYGPVLTAEAPIHYERTSGSSALAKDIPYTPKLLGQLQRALTVWLAKLYEDCPGVAGPAWWSLSPSQPVSTRTENGVPIGSAGDEVYLQGSAAEQVLATIIDMRPELAADDWKARMLAMAVNCEELALISVWSPTYLVAVLDTVADEDKRERGLTALQPLLRPQRYRALVNAVDAKDFSLLWPKLKVISAWSDGPSRLYSARIAEQFPQASVVPKGLFATEGVVSLPWGLSQARPLALESHFLEFIDSQGSQKLVEELVAGQVYEPVLTTAGGLYRYALGDLIKVTGFLGNTPTVRFIGRADLRCDLVGEKLDGDLVTGALEAAGLSEPAMLIPVVDSKRPYYVLVTETQRDTAEAAQALDAALKDCFHYRLARDNQQLGAPECVQSSNLSALLHAGWEALDKRAGDVKPAPLVVSPELAREMLARCCAAGVAS